MFLLFFLVFILVFTIFGNIVFASISLVLVFVFLIIYQVISKKKILGKNLVLSILWWFVLAGISFAVKEYHYYQGTQEWQKTLIVTWIVSDISSQWKYIFTYGNDDYLLYSKKEYTIGEQLRIVWRMQKNIQKDWFSYRNISSWTFAVPLFSWSFDFNTWMKMKWRKWTIYEDNSLPLRDEGIGTSSMSQVTNSTSHIWLVKQLKKSIQEKVIQAYGNGKVSWLILWMLIGDKSQIPESEYQNFIDSWLVHLVAVSGGNILMIVVFLQCILIFIPFYPRIGLILFTIIGYSLICWLDSSVFRAVLMGGLNMVALFRWREINIRRLLSISCIIMLIINPYFLAYDTGFLLSYSALIGIIYFETPPNPFPLHGEGAVVNDSLQKEDKKENKLIIKWLQYIYKTYISPSIGASIGIFPIIIFFMGKINLMGIVGNLFVLPIVPFVMIYWFISVGLYNWLWWTWIVWIEELAVQYIYKISELLSTYGLYIMVSWLWIKYAFLVIFLIGFVYRRYKKMDNNG